LARPEILIRIFERVLGAETAAIAMLVFVCEDIGVYGIRVNGVKDIHGVCILIFA
jgi:hypothetical protein